MKDLLIEVLHLSARSANVLKAGGLRTIGDVQAVSDNQLCTLPNCGWKSVYEIRGEIGRLMTAKLAPPPEPLTEERVRAIFAQEMVRVEIEKRAADHKTSVVLKSIPAAPLTYLMGATKNGRA